MINLNISTIYNFSAFIRLMPSVWEKWRLKCEGAYATSRIDMREYMLYLKPEGIQL